MNGETGTWVAISAMLLSAILAAIWYEIRCMAKLLRSRTHWLRDRMHWVILCVELIARHTGTNIPPPPDEDWPVNGD